MTLDILIADDHELVREGLKSVVKRFPFVASVHGVTNGREALDQIRKLRPHVLLMDVDMPEMDGIDASKEVLAKYPDVRIIIISAFTDEKIIFHTIELGVHGYLLKDSKPAELEKAISQVMSTGFYHNEMVVNVMRKGMIRNSDKPAFSARTEITGRERQILKLLCYEKTNKEIADEIHLSDRTIEKIKANLAGKLDVKGTVGLVRFAIKNGYDI